MRRFSFRLAQGMALLGGAVMIGLVVLTCLSILGRGLNTFAHSDGLAAIAPALGGWLRATAIGPIPGDFELVEAGMAFSIFAFLPWCQLRQGHATVDVFTSFLPTASNRWLSAMWDAIFAAVLVLIALRLYAGTVQMKGYGQTTFLLQFPIWWAYAVALVAAVVAALTGVYVAVLRLIEAVTGRTILHPPAEPVH